MMATTTTTTTKGIVEQEIEYEKRQTSTAPSCPSLLDTYLTCNVLASQLKSIYRYGHSADCARKLDDFKFCLSTHSLDPDQRLQAWIQRRSEWWAARRVARSSEDVWEIRTEPLENFPPRTPNVTSSTIG